ncbi:SufE family protein [Gilvimarinus sp. SDUM040013]|uniref:SufE family protein n=1 Tax=Gilvimarinus gilvus TaxID=3058038 RepID=A0ABU4RUE7_9GAMM|nr:SufE family protein [Gilvimarinus sp. SDUM040013]MDO3385128.1 SufE family protein [Gilvimarinus sp. SDUM040013]MDX6848503.1 SufE family protein [Gilvimarinus sp. SDUM040013]
MTEFGVDVSAEDIIDTLGFFDDWEDRYKYIIDLGKELPALPESARTEQNLVRGCQSQVWLDSSLKQGKMYFGADSDAFIVKGLLAIVLAAYNGKTPTEVNAFDIDAYFNDLSLLSHLSSTRGNGLKSMVERIQAEATEAL